MCFRFNSALPQVLEMYSWCSYCSVLMVQPVSFFLSLVCCSMRCLTCLGMIMHFLSFVLMLAHLKVIVEKHLSLLFITVRYLYMYIILKCKSVSIHFSTFLPFFFV